MQWWVCMDTEVHEMATQNEANDIDLLVLKHVP
jgi:hypothetical protein